MRSSVGGCVEYVEFDLFLYLAWRCSALALRSAMSCSHICDAALGEYPERAISMRPKASASDSRTRLNWKTDIINAWLMTLAASTQPPPAAPAATPMNAIAAPFR